MKVESGQNSREPFDPGNSTGRSGSWYRTIRFDNFYSASLFQMTNMMVSTRQNSKNGATPQNEMQNKVHLM